MAERICGEKDYRPKYLLNYRIFITGFMLKDSYEASGFWPVSERYTTRYEISCKVNYLITNVFI